MIASPSHRRYPDFERRRVTVSLRGRVKYDISPAIKSFEGEASVARCGKGLTAFRTADAGFVSQSSFDCNQITVNTVLCLYIDLGPNVA